MVFQKKNEQSQACLWAGLDKSPGKNIRPSVPLAWIFYILSKTAHYVEIIKYFSRDRKKTRCKHLPLLSSIWLLIGEISFDSFWGESQMLFVFCKTCLPVVIVNSTFRKWTLNYRLRSHFSVSQLPTVILSHSASGVHQITATKVIGRWCLQSNLKLHTLGWHLWLTTQREVLMVRTTEEKLNECFRILPMPSSSSSCSIFRGRKPCKVSLNSVRARLNLYWIVFVCLYSGAHTGISPNVGVFVKWFAGMTVLWGGYKTVKCENFTLFYHPRPLPSPKLPSHCRGLWDMRVLFHQPSLARKRQVLQLTGGSVWGWSSSGEPHTPDQASSLRFSCSHHGSHPQETWRPKVRKQTQNRLFQPVLHCLFRVFIIYVSVYWLCSTT